MPGIYLVRQDGSLAPMAETPYSSEASCRSFCCEMSVVGSVGKVTVGDATAACARNI